MGMDCTLLPKELQESAGCLNPKPSKAQDEVFSGVIPVPPKPDSNLPDGELVPRDRGIAALPALELVHEYLDKNFDLLDRNKDGTISLQEIDRIAKRQMTPEDKKFMDILNSGFALELSEQCNEEWGWDLGITRKDVTEFGKTVSDYAQWREKQRQVAPDAFQISNYGIAKFDKLDSNHTGYISTAELDVAIQASKDEKERKVLTDMRSDFDEIRYLTGKPFSVELLSNYWGIREEKFRQYLDKKANPALMRQNGVWQGLKEGIMANIRFDMLSYYDEGFRKTLLPELQEDK